MSISTLKKLSKSSFLLLVRLVSNPILSSFFRYLNHPFKYVIPDRFIDGYGPNIRLLDQNLDKEINNIIFLDCGSNSHDVINYLKTKNIKTIIIDHHIINNFDIPKSDILINPIKNT